MAVPRSESRYPLASFCNRNDAASIVLKRLSKVSAYGLCRVLSGHRSVPLLDFIIPVVCLFDMTCSNCVSATRRRIRSVAESAGSAGRTSLHHHLRRRAVDILLEACGVRVSREAQNRRGHRGVRYPPKTWLRIAAVCCTCSGRVSKSLIVGTGRQKAGKDVAEWISSKLKVRVPKGNAPQRRDEAWIPAGCA
jgi:hypothetical protein